MIAIQITVIVVLLAAVATWAIHFPYPSPLLRPFLPGKERWPETQIRGWLQTGGFHPRYLDFFYRDPERRVPAGAHILAPADGLLTSADVRDDVRYVVIALSFWDMHIQRCPLAGRVRAIEAHGESFMDGEGREFAFLRAKHCPVQKRIVLDTAIGTVAVRLITSIAARRLETWVEPGEDVAAGQRIGRILLGSTVVLELPAAYQVTPGLADRVRAGQTILAAAEPSAGG